MLARVAAVLVEEFTPFLRQRHHVVAPAS